MKKLHVLHVIGKLNSFGGTPAKLYYQVTAPSDEVRYTICCMEKDGHMAGKFREQGIQVVTLNRSRNSDPRQFFELVSLIRKIKPDVIHTHFARSNTYGRLAAMFCGVPVLISEHGIFRHSSPSILFFDNVLNLFTKYNVSNSHATMQSVQKAVRLNRKNMLVLHNGVPDTFDGPPWRDRKELKQEFGLDPKGFFILDVGSHIPLRNHETLLRAVALAKDVIQGVQCVLIGDGRTRAFLESESARLGIEDCVQFWKRRPREEVHRLLPACDLFVNPTLEEGFGIATVEAMLTERPVICAASGSLVELMENEKEGLFFPPGDEKALAECILRIHEQPDFALSLGENARKRACSSFSIDRFVRDFEALYQEMAAKGKGRSAQ